MGMTAVAFSCCNAFRLVDNEKTLYHNPHYIAGLIALFSVECDSRFGNAYWAKANASCVLCTIASANASGGDSCSVVGHREYLRQQLQSDALDRPHGVDERRLENIRVAVDGVILCPFVSYYSTES
jgi:hypothetical protein